MNTRCIAVIGHVDHGKTSLVRALTGTDTDRLPEEKARGLSITPGYAHHSYATGTLDFVDTPGHLDFIQAMVAGTSGAAAVLVVVAADEGIGAQTFEHLEIAGILGVRQVVVAVTKSDLVEGTQQDRRLANIGAVLAEVLESPPHCILCSAKTGAGINALHAALQATLAHPAPGPPLQGGFLPVDRAFSLAGRGTIVTGTLQGRALTAGDRGVLQPSGQSTTLRRLQSRGADRDVIHPGERMAANLRGIALADVPRGAVLTTDAALAPSSCLDVQLSLLPKAPPLKHMTQVRVMIGTTSTTAQLRLFGSARLAAGQTALAQLRFPKPLVAYAGQRAVVRALSPGMTLGGAQVLDPIAVPAKAGDGARTAVLEATLSGQPALIAKALARGAAAQLADVARLSRLPPHSARDRLGAGFIDLGAGLICATEDLDSQKADLLAALRGYHGRFPLRIAAPRAAVLPARQHAALGDRIEDILCDEAAITRSDRGLALAGHDPVEQLTARQKNRIAEVAKAIQDAGLSPPTANTLQDDRDLTALLIHTGTLVQLRNVALKQDLLLHATTLALAAATLSAVFPAPARFTTSQARSALNTSRRVIVPVLEYFDACGQTERHGDQRQMRAQNIIPPAASP